MRKAPQQIAAEIAEALPTQDFDEVNVVGPYLNFFFK